MGPSLSSKSGCAFLPPCAECVSPRESADFTLQSCGATADLFRTRKNQLRIAEAARLAQAKAFRQRDIRLGRLLDHNQRMRLQPAALAQGFQRGRRKALAIGRIEKGEAIALAFGGGAQFARVAAQQPGGPFEPQRLQYWRG